ncbi:ABC-type multidrug transport system permease subunit [Kutzneria viridogrisea]|uniref:ABC-type multidrug transport system permease subunit n=2 Tax=Kutzneria TaxID=43356 RepID=A0ABR6BWR0_9PSEU|nr:hypothetical protein [Kutzneria albida]MBA8931042.1 ABC-type multidrug transport system permease subunit [Kutzneria viridogrisea]
MTRSAPGGKLMPLSMVVFAIGLVALAVIFGMYASGVRDLPLWLNLVGVLLSPIGFAMGMVAVFLQNRSRE